MTANFQLKLPDVGEGITEAEVVEWHIKVGDSVVEDQALADVMTDKVTIEIPAPVNGVISAIHCEVGETIAVGSVVLEIATDGKMPEPSNDVEVDQPQEDVKAAQQLSKPAVETEKTKPTAVKQTESKQTEAKAVQAVNKPSTAHLDTPLAAPATRRRAYEMGIPLQFVTPTGPGGRITSEDLDAYVPPSENAQRGNASFVKRTAINEVKIIGLRRKIAERMQDAKSRIPHFSYVEELDLTELEMLRKRMNDERSDGLPKLTLLPFFMRAMVLLQPEFPMINSRYDDADNVLHTHDGVHIGIATQTSTGLMVPVVRHAEARDIWDCANEVKRVAEAAKNGTAKLEEMSGSTITLTSLGVLGGVSATPVINSPEVAIIGPNKLMPKPVVKDGEIQVRTMMNLSTSFDHRIVDGYDAASYVQRLKRLIECPAFLFMEAF